MRILAPNAQYDVVFVAAAITLRCGWFATGATPVPTVAAAHLRAVLDDRPISKSAAAAVNGWLTKLQKLEQACLDNYADTMTAQIEAASRLVQSGCVVPLTEMPTTPAEFVRSNITRWSKRELKQRTRNTPTYALRERRVVGGVYDWDM